MSIYVVYIEPIERDHLRITVKTRTPDMLTKKEIIEVPTTVALDLADMIQKEPSEH